MLGNFKNDFPEWVDFSKHAYTDRDGINVIWELIEQEVSPIHYSHRTPFGTYESNSCLLYTSPSPRDRTRSRMPSSA